MANQANHKNKVWALGNVGSVMPVQRAAASNCLPPQLQAISEPSVFKRNLNPTCSLMLSHNFVSAPGQFV